MERERTFQLIKKRRRRKRYHRNQDKIGVDVGGDMTDIGLESNRKKIRNKKSLRQGKKEDWREILMEEQGHLRHR
jgi:hypothetical protein